MPVTVVCPACQAKLKAPDNLMGKAVKCPSCSKPVLVKAAAAAPAPPPAIKKAAKPPQPEILDEEPIEDEVVAHPRPQRLGVPEILDEEPIEDEVLPEEEEVEAKPKKRKRGDSTDNERSTASLIHLGTLINLIFAPIGYLVPIFLWISKRKESAFVDHHGKTWLNFHINMFVLNLGLLVLIGVLAGGGYFIAWWLMLIFIVLGVLAVFALSIYMLIMYIVAGMKAKKGEWFEYKMFFKVLK